MLRTAVVVDDHEVFRRFARLLLEDAGFEVVGEAATATGGLDCVRHLRPDLVLLDVLLPDGSGIDVVRALRTEPVRSQVLLVSSRTVDDLGTEALDGTAFVTKGDLSVAALRAFGS